MEHTYDFVRDGGPVLDFEFPLFTALLAQNVTRGCVPDAFGHEAVSLIHPVHHLVYGGSQGVHIISLFVVLL